MAMTTSDLRKLRGKYLFALTNPSISGPTATYLRAALSAIEYKLAKAEERAA